MSLRALPIALVGSLALLGASQAFPATGGADAHAPNAAPLLAPQRVSRVAASVALPAARRAARRPIVRVAPGASLALRERPGGRVFARLAGRTQFGSPTALAVVSRRGRWLGLASSSRPNGRLAWVDRRARGLRLRSTVVTLQADLSRHLLVLRRGDRVLRRVSVAVGKPGSPTPTGRFSVTDKLPGTRFGPYYGCCVLALSGFQPNPPAGWKGGNRLAIHGTNIPGGVGRSTSAGCLRAGDGDLAALMRLVPAGTTVTVRP